MGQGGLTLPELGSTFPQLKFSFFKNIVKTKTSLDNLSIHRKGSNLFCISLPLWYYMPHFSIYTVIFALFGKIGLNFALPPGFWRNYTIVYKYWSPLVLTVDPNDNIANYNNNVAPPSTRFLADYGLHICQVQEAVSSPMRFWDVKKEGMLSPHAVFGHYGHLDMGH